MMRLLFLVIFSYIMQIYSAFAGSLTKHTCSIISVSVNFGTINTLDTNSETISANIGVYCSSILPDTVKYTLSFSAGGSANMNDRTLTHNNLVNTMMYNLYTDAAHLQVLGDGTSGTNVFSNSYTLGLSDNQTDYFTIYGLIPVQTTASAGNYSDNLIVTLEY